MKLKIRVWNQYLGLAIILPIFFAVTSWAAFSGYFDLYFISDWAQADMGVSREEYFEMIYPFSSYMFYIFRIFQLILPALAMIPIIPYFQELKNIPFIYPRIKSYRRTLLGISGSYTLIGALALYFSYLIIMLIGLSFQKVSPDQNSSHDLYSDIFGPNFYDEHQIWYFVFDGFIKFFVLSIVYSAFAIGVSFLTQKRYLALLIPVGYFALLSAALSVVGALFKFDTVYFSPAYTVVPSSRAYTSIWLVLLPLLPPLIFTLSVFVREVFSKRKRDDAVGIH